MYQRVLMNLVGARKRYETLEGKKYLVLPAVSLTEGVHNGSQGPLLYLEEEIAKNPVVWNTKPVVLDHPTFDGTGVTACDPSILEKQQVGMIFNSRWDGKLKEEVWADEDKLRRLSPETMRKIDNNEMVEISTGLFHDREEKSGDWKGEAYDGIVRNIQPDHLAILTKEKGACSIQDGAGLLRNADGTEISYDEIREQIRSLIKAKGTTYCYVCEIYPKFAIYEEGMEGPIYKIGYKVRSGKVSLDGEPAKVKKQTSYVSTNGERIFNNNDQGPNTLPTPHIGELSDPMRRNQLQSALAAHYASMGNSPGVWSGWVTTVFANQVVYSKDGKQFRLPYTYDNDKINFDGEPEEVEKVIEYRTKQPDTNNQEQPQMATKAQIDTINRLAELARTKPNELTTNVIHQGANELINDPAIRGGGGNKSDEKSDSQARGTGGGGRKGAVDLMISSGGWGEEDRKFLMDLPDDGFEKVSKYVAKGANQAVVPYTYDGIGDRSNAHNAQGRSVTTAQYIEQAPPEVRELLSNALSTHNEEKARLVSMITSNKSNVFTPEWLATLPINQLKGMARLAGVQQTQRVANYAGQAEIPMFLDRPLVDNTQQPGEEEVLPIPTINFEKQTA